MVSGKFDAGKVWETLLIEEDPCNVFMAVPTVYNNLTRYLDNEMKPSEETKKHIKKILSS
jgi:hypothetical protein